MLASRFRQGFEIIATCRSVNRKEDILEEFNSGSSSESWLLNLSGRGGLIHTSLHKTLMSDFQESIKVDSKLKILRKDFTQIHTNYIREILTITDIQ